MRKCIFVNYEFNKLLTMFRAFFCKNVRNVYFLGGYSIIVIFYSKIGKL
ncbi:hypothetical protein HMPREF1566_0110 [Providencia alcalifaciens PAL-1]|nr:hypothetical protein HMPREF1566_0110 [Providencia alcalifaciens PAL-1]